MYNKRVAVYGMFYILKGLQSGRGTFTYLLMAPPSPKEERARSSVGLLLRAFSKWGSYEHSNFPMFPPAHSIILYSKLSPTL